MVGTGRGLANKQIQSQPDTDTVLLSSVKKGKINATRYRYSFSRPRKNDHPDTDTVLLVRKKVTNQIQIQFYSSEKSSCAEPDTDTKCKQIQIQCSQIQIQCKPDTDTTLKQIQKQC